MVRCGACNKTFDKPKDLMHHIENDCGVAKETLKAVDIIVPEAEGRGVLSMGVGDIDVNKINNE